MERATIQNGGFYVSFFLLMMIMLGKADQLEKTVTRLSMVTRVVNGIAIQQELNKNAAKPLDVAADMIGVKDGDSLLKFSNILPGNISTNLNTLPKTFLNIDGRNVNKSDEGMQMLGKMRERLQELKFAVGYQIPSDFKEVFDTAREFTGVLYGSYNNNETVIPFREALATISEADFEHTQAEGLGKIENAIKILLNKDFHNLRQTHLPIYKSNLQDLFLIVNKTESIKQLKVVAEVSENYSKNSELFTSLKQNAGNLKTTVREMIHATATSLEWGEIGDQLKKAHKVISDIPTSSDRKMTLGFPNNGKDVAEIGRDLKNAWIKENLAGGKDMKELDALLNPLVKWGKTFQAIYDSWGSMMSDSKSDLVDISSVIIDLAEHGKTLSADTDVAKYVKTIENCVNKLGPHDENNSHFGEFQRLHDFLIASDEKVTTLKTGMAKLNELNVIKNRTNYDVLKDFAKKSNNTSSKNLEKYIEEFKVTEAYKFFSEELKEIEQVFQPLTDDTLRIFLNSYTPRWEIIDEMIRGFNKTNLLEVLGCLENISYDSSRLSIVSKFGEDIELVKAKRKEIDSAVRKMKDVSVVRDAVIKLKTSPLSRRRRASSKVLNMENSMMLTHDLAMGMKVLRKMGEVHSIGLEKLMDSKEVDAAIQKVPGSQSIWTQENRNALKNLGKSLSELDKDSKSDNISDSWKIFDKAQKVGGVSFNISAFGDPIAIELAKDSKSSIKSEVKKFEKLGKLHLDFAKTRIDLKGAYVTLSPIQYFFDDFFGTQENDLSRNSDGNIEGSGFNYMILVWIFIGLAVIILIVGIAVLIYFKKHNNNMKDVKKKNTDKYLSHAGLLRTLDGETNRSNIVIAAKEGHLEYVKLLIKENTYLDLIYLGNTALHVAIENCHPKIVEVLIKAGANRSILNVEKKTPLELLNQKLINEQDDIELLEIKSIFEKLEKTVFTAQIPNLLPIKKYSIDITRSVHSSIDRFKSQFAENILRSLNEKRFSSADLPSHYVVDVNKDGVYDIDALLKSKWKTDSSDTDIILAAFPIFAQCVLVGSSWIDACLENPKNLHNDYEYRVKKVKYSGKVFETVDEWRKAVHLGDHGFMTGTYIMMPSPDASTIEPFTALVNYANGNYRESVIMKTNFPDDPPHFHPNLKNRFIVVGSNKGQALLVELKKPMSSPFEAFSIVSLEDFVVFLIERKKKCQCNAILNKERPKDSKK